MGYVNWEIVFGIQWASVSNKQEQSVNSQDKDESQEQKLESIHTKADTLSATKDPTAVQSWGGNEAQAHTSQSWELHLHGQRHFRREADSTTKMNTFYCL